MHPEAYPVVRRILTTTGRRGRDADRQHRRAARAASPTTFVDETFGLPTVTDILRELEKPGRDPRPAFKTATFAEGVEKIGDLEPGMVLEGVVTNVAAFGAFVDIGVHQDGLVHVSAMSKTFVKDPRDVVKSGDMVRVKVLDVDMPRKRISLTLRLDDDASAPGGAPQRERGGRGQGARARATGLRTSARAGQSQGQGRASSAGVATAAARAAAPEPAGRRPGGDRQGGGQGRGSAPAPVNSAMADALRKAGLVDPKGRGGR